MAEEPELRNLRTSFGKKALELVKTAKRSRWLPEYPDKQIEDVAKEINLCHDFVKATIEMYDNDFAQQPTILAPVTVRYAEIMRNRRCVFSVLHHRMNAIRNIWWEHGAIIPADKRKKLSKREEAYFSAYNMAMSQYCQEIGGIDLSQDREPPRDLFIEVRVLKSSEYAVTLSSGGSMMWKEGETHRMRREDADLWIRNGYLAEIVCDGDGSDH